MDDDRKELQRLANRREMEAAGEEGERNSRAGARARRAREEAEGENFAQNEAARDDAARREADEHITRLMDELASEALSTKIRESYNHNAIKGQIVPIDHQKEARARALAENRRAQFLEGRSTSLHSDRISAWHNTSNFPAPDGEVLEDHMGGQGHREALIAQLAEERSRREHRGGQGHREPPYRQHAEARNRRNQYPSERYGDYDQQGGITAQGRGRGRSENNEPSHSLFGRAPSPRAHGVVRFNNGRRIEDPRSTSLQRTPPAARTMARDHNQPSRAVAMQTPVASNTPRVGQFQYIIDEIVEAARQDRARDFVVAGANETIMGYGTVVETVSVRAHSIYFALCTPAETGPWPLANAPANVLVPAVRRFLVQQALKMAFNYDITSTAAKAFLEYFDKFTKPKVAGATRLSGAAYQAISDARNYGPEIQARYDAERMWIDVLRKAREMLADPSQYALEAAAASAPSVAAPEALRVPEHSQTAVLPTALAAPPVTKTAQTVSPVTRDAEQTLPTPERSDPVDPVESTARRERLARLTPQHSDVDSIDTSSSSSASSSGDNSMVARTLPPMNSAPTAGHGTHRIRFWDQWNEQMLNQRAGDFQTTSTDPFRLDIEVHQTDSRESILRVLENPTELVRALFDMAVQLDRNFRQPQVDSNAVAGTADGNADGTTDNLSTAMRVAIEHEAPRSQEALVAFSTQQAPQLPNDEQRQSDRFNAALNTTEPTSPGQIAAAVLTNSARHRNAPATVHATPSRAYHIGSRQSSSESDNANNSSAAVGPRAETPSPDHAQAAPAPEEYDSDESL